MDLHVTEATASLEERTAVDAVLGEPESGWRGGERDQLTSRVAQGGHDLREKRHMLLPALHAVQDRLGWISPGALNYVSERLMVPPAETYAVASFYALFSTEARPGTVVHVCDDIACKTSGADDLCARLEERIGPAGTPKDGATWLRSPCLGLCENAPGALVQKAGEDALDVSLAPVDADLLGDVMQGIAIAERVAGPAPQTGDADLRLLARVGVVDPTSIDDYRAKGGYQALRRALLVGASEVIREVTDSKLMGRGGAAFPTGVKWKAVSQAPTLPHYVICNADESEPGTFKDRVLMEGDPFAVIESLTIAGFACGAHEGYIYIRGEYPEATRRLQGAVEQARRRGFLGEDIMERGYSFDIDLRRGAGAYICGEETALMESIEGQRGEPRNKPPFPVSVGLFGKPTAVNNVETLVNVLSIMKEGGPQIADVGTAASTGPKLFCLSGCVERPGVYEVPFGATLGDLLDMAGGVRGRRALQTILLGGASGVFLRPDELDMPLTFEGARAAGVGLGSGVVMVFDDSIDIKAILLRIAAFFRDESCGQCVPCRVGTVRQEEALHRLIGADGDGAEELEVLADLGLVMRDASICGLGQTASSAIESAVNRLGMFEGART